MVLSDYSTTKTFILFTPANWGRMSLSGYGDIFTWAGYPIKIKKWKAYDLRPGKCVLSPQILFPLCLVPPGSGGLSTCAHLLHPHLGASCQYGPHRSREHGCFCFHGQSRNHASQEAVHVIALSLRGLKNCQGQSIGNPGFLKPCSNLLSLFWTDEVRERKKRG